MQIQIAAKRVKGEWKSATIVDGQFESSEQMEDLSETVMSSIVPLLAVEMADGTRVTVTAIIEPVK